MLCKTSTGAILPLIHGWLVDHAKSSVVLRPYFYKLWIQWKFIFLLLPGFFKLFLIQPGINSVQLQQLGMFPSFHNAPAV